MVKKTVSLLFLGFGIFLLIQVVMPVLAFKIWEVTSLGENVALIDPDPPQETQVLGVKIENVGNFPAFVSTNKKGSKNLSEFFLTIPKIDLNRVQVNVETNNFEESLAHLPGSALPGEKGNVFITGHSSLVQLYKPGNFKAIFANLPKVEKGDKIEVEVMGQRYNYRVENIKIVSPKDTSVINPPDEVGRYLTLMTCVPPGFNTKRLIITSKLI